MKARKATVHPHWRVFGIVCLLSVFCFTGFWPEAIAAADSGKEPPGEVLKKASAESSKRRIDAVRRLAEFKSEKAIQMLMEATKDQNLRVREEALRSLGKIGKRTPEIISVVKKRLDDASDRVRKRAARTLIELYDWPRRRWKEIYEGAETPRTRALALWSLIRIDADFMPGEVRSFARSKNPAFRRVAALGLAKIGGNKDVELLRSLAKDPNATVRRAVSDACVEMKDATEAAGILKPLVSDKNREVRRQSMKNLAEVESARVGPIFLSILREEKDEKLRKKAAELVRGAEKGWKVLEQLEKVLEQEQEPDVRQAMKKSIKVLEKEKAEHARMQRMKKIEGSPVKEMKRAAEKIQRLQPRIRKAIESANRNKAQRLREQLRGAKARQQTIVDRVWDKYKLARKKGWGKVMDKFGPVLTEVRKIHKKIESQLWPARKFAPPESPVVINEICYWPEKGENEWVELKNISDSPVDISRWVLVDGQRVMFPIPDELPPVPPDGYVLILFDGTGKPPAPFNKKGKAVVHTPPELTGDMLGDEGGHLALYLTGNQGFYGGDRTIRAYVAWGLSPGRLVSAAVNRGCWSRISAVAAHTRGREVSREKKVQQGGSIYLPPGLDRNPSRARTWRVAFPSEVSPGTGNIRYPMPRAVPPHPTRAGKDGKPAVGCAPIEEKGVRYHVQIFTDKACNELFLDAPDLKNSMYILEKPVPEDSTLYWRIRAVYPDGGKSKWTEPRKITRGTPKK